MLLSGFMIQVKTPPEVISSLSVSINQKCKKRLIFDLRYVNGHLYKEKIVFDDCKCFEITYRQIRVTFSILIATTTSIYFSHGKCVLVFLGILTVPPNILFLLFYHQVFPQHLLYLRMYFAPWLSSGDSIQNCLFLRQRSCNRIRVP